MLDRKSALWPFSGGGGDLQMEEKKKSPSFPSNYVTLAQLQERRLKEKERKRQEEEQQQQQQEEDQKQKQKQKLEDLDSVAGKVEAESEYRSHSCWRLRRGVRGETSVRKEDEVAGGDVVDQEGKGEEKAKKKNKKKKWKGKKRSFAAELEVAGEGVVAEAPLASVEKEDVPKSGSRESKGEASAENDSLDQVSNVEPKSRASSVNGGIGKRNEGLRRNGERRNAKRSGSRHKTRAEKAPKFSALSVNGGIVKVTDELGENAEVNNKGSRGTRGETGAESIGLDQTAYIEPNFRALSVNGVPGNRNYGLKRNGEKRNQGSGRTRGETKAESNNLDHAAQNGPESSTSSVYRGIDRGSNGLRRRDAYHSNGYLGFERFGRREVGNPKDSRMVWVKKGEVSDGNGSEH